MTSIIKKLMAVTVLCLALQVNANAQKAAIKSNLLYDATATANLGLELGLAPKWTLDISGNAHLWNVWDDSRLKHLMLQPEIRYWFCERFNGHFLGFHLLGGKYNVGNISNNIDWMPFIHTSLDYLENKGTFKDLTDHRFQGWFAGAGIAYGYSLILSRHWNLEFELGMGYIHTVFDVYQCKDCGKKVKENQPYNYVGPTKAAINLVYEF